MGLTKTEPGCLFYGFTQAGNKFHCREAYKSGEDVLAHLKNVDAPLQKVAKYVKSLAIMGPKREIKKTREATAALGTTYWELDGGSFTRILQEGSKKKSSKKKGATKVSKKSKGCC